MTQNPVAHIDDKEKTGRSSIDRTLETILASGALGHSERRARLLKYIVEHEFSGNGNTVKAYSIALDVFGRDETFDPNTDSIVRVEIGRLRDALKIFYGEHTSDDLWRIDIPKGTYRPKLTPPSSPQEPEEQTRRVPSPTILSVLILCLVLILALSAFFLHRDPARPSDEATDQPYPVLRIAVMPFEATGDHPDIEQVAFGLYTELSMDLSAYPWIAVVSPLDPDEFGADYALKSQLFWQGDILKTNSQLISLPDERLVWSKAYNTSISVEGIQETQRQITSGIADSLGSENGISTDIIVARNARDSAANLEGFICFISTYRYIESPSDEEHRRLRDCLEKAVEDYPDFGEAFAALGVLYMDEERYGRNPRPGQDSWADAKAAIDRSLELAPLRNGPLLAGLALSVQAPEQDLDRAWDIGAKLMELFPRHPETLVLIGSLLSEYFGQWSQGLDLAEQAIALEHSPPSIFFLTPAYYAAMQSDDEAAFRTTEPLTTASSANELLLRYLAAARIERRDLMQENRSLLAEENIVSDEDLVNFVKNRRFHDALETTLLGQLEMAFEMTES